MSRLRWRSVRQTPPWRRLWSLPSSTAPSKRSSYSVFCCVGSNVTVWLLRSERRCWCDLLFHTYQGVYGMLAVLVFGLVLSVYYLRTQALFPVTFAHILADIVPFTGLLNDLARPPGCHEANRC